MAWTKRQLQQYIFALRTVDRLEQELEKAGLMIQSDTAHDFYMGRIERVQSVLDDGHYTGIKRLPKGLTTDGKSIKPQSG